MNDEYKNTENPLAEDWAMGEESNIQPNQDIGTDNFDITMLNTGVSPVTPVTPISEDWTMNVPKTNPNANNSSDNWQMPTPVFRNSSGKKLEKVNRINSPNENTAPAVPPFETGAANLEIQPQPYISEEFSMVEPAAEAPAKAQGKTTKLIF